MLDLTQLALQMQGISDHLQREATAAQRRIALARDLLDQAIPHQAALCHQLREPPSPLAFTAAEPIEPLSTRVAVAPAPAAHTVLATDGSQISPSHHEIAYCYLLNVGRVVLHYGQSRYPQLDSLPEVVYRSEDLYGSRQWGIGTEEWLGYRRTVAEAVVLAELGEAAPTVPGLPTVALVDGSLVYWMLEGLAAAARDHILPPILTAWEALRQRQIPVVGYLSASRSGEALNFLRLVACPHDLPHCQHYCNGRSDGAPCGSFSPLRDVTFWASVLSPGERGPLWRSSAPILAQYGDHTVYFCHLHVGPEVARVEVPQWVATDETLLNQALALVLAQVSKGYGYPVALAEAHNQAVVRGGDRARFFALLEQQMVRAGLQNVGTSYKEARKRGSIA